MGIPLLTSECHGQHQNKSENRIGSIMALYHFKKDVINSNEQSNNSNNSGNLFQQNDSKPEKFGGFPSNSSSSVFQSSSNSSVFQSSSNSSGFQQSNSQPHFNCKLPTEEWRHQRDVEQGQP